MTEDQHPGAPPPTPCSPPPLCHPAPSPSSPPSRDRKDSLCAPSASSEPADGGPRLEGHPGNTPACGRSPLPLSRAPGGGCQRCGREAKGLAGPWDQRLPPPPCPPARTPRGGPPRRGPTSSPSAWRSRPRCSSSDTSCPSPPTCTCPPRPLASTSHALSCSTRPTTPPRSVQGRDISVAMHALPSCCRRD